MPIYTRTGDTGTTALFGGKRVLKSDEVVDLYGSIDELNSWVGLIAAEITEANIRKFLFTIQSDLFTIGSTLAGWQGGKLEGLEERASEMEHEIDEMEKTLSPLANFILPGGSKVGSAIHIVRSVCRRAERQLVAYAQKQPIDGNIIKYINRLSDLFFVLARYINKNERVEEVAWIGIPRPKKINKK
jgi:cob(I)alamin adenosyltransferase